MKLKTLKEDFFLQLETKYPKEEVQSFFYILCDFYLKYSRFQISLHQETIIKENQLLQFKNAINRLLKNEPIQYITGETAFYGLSFIVNKHTLIPRPETEELVDWIVQEFKAEKAKIKILDIGTGSGCIAISLAKNLREATITAIEIATETIAVAVQNATRNKVVVHFLQENILKMQMLPEQYDVIVSNPPYVRELEKQQMKANVLDYEPETALFVSDEDPLVFYKKIGLLALQKLKKKGWLYYEINEFLETEMKTMLQEIGFTKIELKKDYRGAARMIRCRKK